MSISLLRVASFNTQLLARSGVPFHEQPPYTPEEYEAKTGFIGGLLERGQVDIAGFQEVFHEDALRHAVEKSPRLTGAYVCAPLADDNGPKTPDGALNAPRVGFASRLPVSKAESIRAFPSGLGNGFAVRRDANGRQEAVPVGIGFFERPVLRVEVALPNGVPLAVYVVHLKSRRPVMLEDEDRRDPAVRALAVVRALVQRGAEAAALRVMLTRELEGRGAAPRPVMVLGDLNDELTSATTELIRGEQPLPESLKPLMVDPGDWQRKNRRLWDLHLYAASDQQASHIKGTTLYTHIHFGDYQALDHILFSQEFYSRNPNRIGDFRYLQVYNDHVVDTHMTDINRNIRTASDHGVPVAEFTLLARSTMREGAAASHGGPLGIG
ncbi:endonuclease/exonuclease/phosphatase family protein [Labrys okinawensis]|uniref:endonuclease/exonuclease/phosphatase family protein n=1 Tax=Labrys okinawensis TaxID=346911 RepID=UPI0039BD37A9